MDMIDWITRFVECYAITKAESSSIEAATALQYEDSERKSIQSSKQTPFKKFLTTVSPPYAAPLSSEPFSLPRAG
jgi:hypothetical protein